MAADTIYTIELIDGVSPVARRARQSLRRLDAAAQNVTRTLMRAGKASALFTRNTRSLVTAQRKAERSVMRTGKALREVRSEALKTGSALAAVGGGVGGGRGRGGGGPREKSAKDLKKDKFKRQLRFANSLTAAGRGVDQFRRGMQGLFTEPIRQALSFQRGIAEVSTLVDETTFSTDQMRKATLGAAKEFGGPAQTQASALYDIVSAGSFDAASATAILNESNRLAIAGITDVSTAADGMTSIMNAYGVSAGDASTVSDTFFATVKAGKTTVSKLSRAVGRVAPIAAALGIEFEEVGAILATLTVGGLSTAEASTAARSLLTSFKNASKESKKFAAGLGFRLDTSSIKKFGGIGGALKELARLSDAKRGKGKIGDTFDKVFKNVRGNLAAQVLAARNFSVLNSKSAILAKKLGSVEEAMRKVAAQDFQKLKVAQANFTNLKIAIGEKLTPKLTEYATILSNDVIPATSAWMEENAFLTKAIAGVGLAIIGVLFVVGPLLKAGGILVTVWGLIAGWSGIAMAAVFALGVAFGVLFAKIGNFLTGGLVTKLQSFLLLATGAGDLLRDIGIGNIDTRDNSTEKAKEFMRRRAKGGDLENATEEELMAAFDDEGNLRPETPSGIASRASQVAAATGASRGMGAGDRTIGEVNVEINVEGAQSPEATSNEIARKFGDEVGDILQREAEGIGAPA